MKYKNIKKNRGFVLLFAVTIAALLLSIALGVANIALKEVKFSTSAKDANNAFFATDTGIEYALFHDKTPGYVPAFGTKQSWNVVVSGLGSDGTSCATVSIEKDNTNPPATLATLVSDGYNIGDVNCTSPSTNRVAREFKVLYGGAPNLPPLTNFALPVNGGSAIASSTVNASFPASAAINGDRNGIGWGTGTGGWNDGTYTVFPDSLEVDFSGAKKISEIDVYTLADGYPVTPTASTPAVVAGITAFNVQYDNGSGWQTIPGGTIAGNTLAWRQFVFSEISNVTKIRINVTAGPAGLYSGYSRIVELEAWGN